jgi:L-asparaginase / beta-aspartyl-peptidase
VLGFRGKASPATGKVVLVMHAVAGTILKSQMSPGRGKAYQAALTEALQKGYDILKKGGTALDATGNVPEIYNRSGKIVVAIYKD